MPSPLTHAITGALIYWTSTKDHRISPGKLTCCVVLAVLPDVHFLPLFAGHLVYLRTLGDQARSMQHWYTHTLWFAGAVAIAVSALWWLTTRQSFGRHLTLFTLASVSHSVLDLFEIEAFPYPYDPPGIPLLAPVLTTAFKAPWRYFLPLAIDWGAINVLPQPSWARAGTILWAFISRHNLLALAREGGFVLILGIGVWLLKRRSSQRLP